MNNDQPQTVSSPATTGKTAVLLLGPVLTVLVLLVSVRTGSLTAIDERVWVAGALLFWSPLPISIPAVLLERERDATLPAAPAAVRAVALVPWMLFAKSSTARAPMAASLAGLALAVWVGMTF